MAQAYITARFTAEGVPEGDRLAIWREHYGREVMRLELEPRSDVAFEADLTARKLPGLAVITATLSAMRAGRTRQLLADGNDDLILHTQSTGSASQFGREVELGPDNATLLSNGHAGCSMHPHASRMLSLVFPRASFAHLLRDPDRVFSRSIPGQTEPFRLLMHQVAALKDIVKSTEMQRVFVDHAYDLIALTLGATREAAEIANSRGLPAARLRAIKSDVLANLHRLDLTVTEVAKRHRITPRHVQRLFESEGTTFSQFLRDQRLARAHRQLTSPQSAGLAISAIAYDSGFSDLSHFNHAFRRAYGATPSDVRAAARRGRNDW